MFPTDRSVIPTPPFPTHGLCRVGISPLSTGTIEELRLLVFRLGPLDFHSRADTSVDPAYSLAAASESPRLRRDVVKPVASVSGILRRRSRALPSSQGTLMCLCPDLRPRSGLRAWPITAHRCCPPCHETVDPRRFCHFSGLNRTALALAVYASCRPRGRRRKTRLRAARLALTAGRVALPFPRGISSRLLPGLLPTEFR